MTKYLVKCHGYSDFNTEVDSVEYIKTNYVASWESVQPYMPHITVPVWPWVQLAPDFCGNIAAEMKARIQYLIDNVFAMCMFASNSLCDLIN